MLTALQIVEELTKLGFKKADNPEDVPCLRNCWCNADLDVVVDFEDWTIDVGGFPYRTAESKRTMGFLLFSDMKIHWTGSLKSFLDYCVVYKEMLFAAKEKGEDCLNIPGVSLDELITNQKMIGVRSWPLKNPS